METSNGTTSSFNWQAAITFVIGCGGATAAAYILSFTYELAYLQYYRIPMEMVEITPEVMILAFLGVAGFIIPYCRKEMLEEGNTVTSTAIIAFVTLFVLLSGLFIVLAVLGIISWLASVAGSLMFLVLVITMAWMAIRGHRYKRKWEFWYLIGAVLLLLAYATGYLSADNKSDYLSYEINKQTFIVIRIHNDKAIVAEVDPTTKSLTGTIGMIPSTSPQMSHLVVLSIGKGKIHFHGNPI